MFFPKYQVTPSISFHKGNSHGLAKKHVFGSALAVAMASCQTLACALYITLLRTKT